MDTRIREEIRCPSCSRLLVLRSGPAITAHFAHRPRQSCRNRPGGVPAGRLRLEQLTLFELEPLPQVVPEPDPFRVPPPQAWAAPVVAAPTPSMMTPPRRKPRRRAWLPRLVRWVKAKTARPVRPARSGSPGGASS